MSKPWADQPFKLMPVPGTEGAPTSTNPAVLYIAADMANVHNALLRGLNAIYLQCTHIQAPADIADFLIYVKAWGDTVHHHHHSEETLFFPRVDELAKEAGQQESVMNANVEQHHAFEPGLGKMIEFAKDVQEGRKMFEGDVLKEIIDGFAPVLTEHLHDEIDTLLKLEPYPEQELRKIYDDVVKVAQGEADTNLVIPLMFGTIDRTSPGSENFPPVLFFFSWLNKYWFERKFKGAWRFNPCDSGSRPRPLQFLGNE